jgi:hypothetical protein
MLEVRQRVISAVIELFHQQESHSIVELVVLVSDYQKAEYADLLKQTKAASVDKRLFIFFFPVIHI